MDGRNAVDLSPRPSGRAAYGRLRHPQGLRDRLQEARAARARRRREARRAVAALPDRGELVPVARRGAREKSACGSRPSHALASQERYIPIYRAQRARSATHAPRRPRREPTHHRSTSCAVAADHRNGLTVAGWLVLVLAGITALRRL